MESGNKTGRHKPYQTLKVPTLYCSLVDKKNIFLYNMFSLGMLKLWHQKMGKDATFLRLGIAFEALKLRNMIIELLNFYCTHSQTVRQEQQVPHVVPTLGM